MQYSVGPSKDAGRNRSSLSPSHQIRNGAREICALLRIVSRREKTLAGYRLVSTKIICRSYQLPPSHIAQSRRSPSHGISARTRFAEFLSANPACLSWITQPPLASAGTERCESLNRWRSESIGTFLMRNQYTSSKRRTRYARNLPASSKTVRASSRRQKVPAMPVSSLGGWSPERRGDSSIIAYARLAKGPTNRS